MQRYRHHNGRRALCLLAVCGVLSSLAMGQSGGGAGGSTSQAGAAGGADETRSVADAWGNEVVIARQPRRGTGAAAGAAGIGGGQVEGEERRRAGVFRGVRGGEPIELTIDADGAVEVSELIARLSQLSTPGLEFRLDRLSERPSLGVILSDADPVLLEHLGLEPGSAVLIQRVVPGTPAEKAGLRANDIVIEVHGQRAGGVERFRALIAEREAGEPVRLKIVRRGERREVDVTPRERERAGGPSVELSLRVDAEASLAAVEEMLKRSLGRDALADMRRDVQEAIGSVEELAERLSSVRFDVSRDAEGRSELRYVDPRTGQERRMMLPGGAARAPRSGWPETELQGLRFVDPQTGEYRLFELPSQLLREVPAERLRELRREDLQRLRAIPGGSGVAERFELRASPQAERLERLEASVERLEGKLDRLLEKLSDR